MIPIYVNETERAEIDDIYDAVLELIDSFRNIENNITELNKKINNFNIKIDINNLFIQQVKKRIDQLYEYIRNQKTKI